MKNGSLGLAVVFMITIVLPVAADHYPQTRFEVSNGVGDKYSPKVVWNWLDDEYLAVWHQTPDTGYRDIRAQRIDKSGNLIGGNFLIAGGFVDRVQPALAYNGFNNEYLAVYMKDNGGVWEIWGKILYDTGIPHGDEFLIRDRPGLETWTPRIAWNSYRNEYGVVWWNFNPDNGSAHSVGFQRLAADGSQLGTYVTVAVTDFDSHSDITYNAAQDEYLIVWTTFNPTSPNGDIRARRYSWDGVGQGDPVSVSQDSPASAFPSVSTNGQGFYVIAWEEWVVGDWDIHAQFHASSDLAIIGERIFVSTEWVIDEGRPRIAVNSQTGQALVVYISEFEQGSLVGDLIGAASINRYQNVPELKFSATETLISVLGEPTIAWGNNDYISVYTSDFVSQEINGCLLGLIHIDGFESGNTAIWSESAP